MEWDKWMDGWIVQTSERISMRERLRRYDLKMDAWMRCNDDRGKRRLAQDSQLPLELSILLAQVHTCMPRIVCVDVQHSM